MIAIAEIRRWLTTLDRHSSVAIDDGGVRLVEVNEYGQPTDAHLEIGGIPDEEAEATS